uniref:CHAT domain-containing protein n=1 Tax=Paractinoplanes polyasparticus TaxID=2856853 RepID=UPI001C85A69E|nr:CHAT domain-containing protein [Actinoplanes polyasparticus]
MTIRAPSDDLARIAVIVWATAGGGDLDAAIGEFRRLGSAAPARSALAAALVRADVCRDPQIVPLRLRALAELVAVADLDPPPVAQWRPVRAAARALAVGQAAADGELRDFRAALAEFDLLAADAAADPPMLTVVTSARMGIEFARATIEGDSAAAADLVDQARRLGEQARASGSPQGAEMADVMAAIGDLMEARRRGEDLAPRLEELRRMVAGLPDGSALRAAVEEAVSMAGYLAGGVDRPDPDQVRRLVDQAAPGSADRSMGLAVLGTAGLADETDPDRIAQAIATMREALAGLGPGHPRRAFHLTGLALALWRQSEVSNRVDGLHEAERLLVEAESRSGGPRNLHSGWIAEMLADIRYRLGARSGGHVGAVDAMRTHLWHVLAQPDLRSAATAARHASQSAADIARKCLVAHDPAEAVRALDSGRGLALHAATEARNLADRLARAGHDDLAARWRAAAAGEGGPSRALRRDVLEVLFDGDLGRTLADPPGADEIGAALRGADADALIYLLPADGAVPGYAVVVSAEGGLSYSALPELRLEAAPDLDAYLVAATRDLPPAVAPARTSLTGSLEALCDWAWRVAIGPIYRGHLARITPSGRPPRVVLIPMGVLARVPWHAARRRDGTYAIQLMAISQAASARLFCHSAGLTPVRPEPLGLIVGDPAGDLPSACAEAYAVHRSFYLGARYAGRRPDGSPGHSGTGTRDEVRRWLASADPDAGSMLHLACHGVVELGEDAPGSYLALADGRLDATGLGSVLAAAPDRTLGLVVLAACSTGRSVTSYDEAYSLGTAFLAAGARSVLSTQWRVPDDGTSALMYVFHRAVMVDGLAPWAALRSAQLWMLDPRRRVWPEMPEAPREQAGRPSAAAVVNWAGFVHGGQ